MGVAGEGGIGRIKFQYRTPSTSDLLSTSRVDDGNWHHIVVTQSGACSGCAKLYIDGTLEDTKDGQTFAKGVEPFIIGADYAGGLLYPYKGSIDELAVFNRALTGEEVRGSFNAGNAGLCGKNRPPIAIVSHRVFVGNPVELDGTESSDPEGEAISVSWSLVSKPAGSAAALSNPSSATTSLVPDLPGRYVVRLVVSDGKDTTIPSEVRILAQTPEQVGHYIDALKLAAGPCLVVTVHRLDTHKGEDKRKNHMLHGGRGDNRSDLSAHHFSAFLLAFYKGLIKAKRSRAEK